MRVGGGHDAAEPGEELVAVLGGDAEPVVDDPDPRRVADVGDVADHLAAARGVLDGVVDDVAQGQHDAFGVDVGEQGLVGQLDAQAVLRRRPRRHRVRRLANQRAHVDGLRLGRGRTVLDARRHEHVVDQAVHLGGAPLEDPHDVVERLRDVAEEPAADQREVAVQDGERAAQLVRGQAEHVRLDPLHRLQAAEPFVQLGQGGGEHARRAGRRAVVGRRRER